MNSEYDFVDLVAGFGTFVHKEMAARKYKIPKTGEIVSKPSKLAPKFIAAKAFKSAIEESREENDMIQS